MKKIIFTIITLLSINLLFADNVKFTARAPSKVGVGQSFQVQYSINSKARNLKLGDYSSFKFISGPSTSSSQSMKIINGTTTTNYSYTYTYVFKASETGTFQIAAASITVNGQEYTSNALTIIVQKDAVQTQSSRNSRYNRRNNTNQATPPPAPKELTNEDLFVRTHVNKTNLYKGEHIIASVKIYAKVDLMGFEDISLPAFDAFYAEEIETPDRINLVRETYNGQTYNVGIIKKYILYPRYAGDLEIEACDITCQVRQVVNNNNGNYMMQIFGYYETISKNIKSPIISIKVNNLPNAPSSFCGAVGNFNMSLEKSSDTVLVNDAVNFKIEISGNGNFNMIETPEISWPKEFEIYEPQASDNTTCNASGLSGSKTWEYTIIPRYPGVFKMGEIEFTYFDLNTNQYKTLTTENIQLAVKKDANDTDFSENSYNYSQTNLDYIGEDDIRFVHYENLHLRKNYIPFIFTSFYSAFLIIPLIIFILIVIILRKKIKESANIAALKEKKAGIISRKRLKKARKLMSNNNSEEFYKEIISALWGYSSDKLGIHIADLSKDRIIIELEKKELDSETITKLISTIEKCEFAHFAPTSDETKLDYIYQETVKIIDNLEQKIK